MAMNHYMFLHTVCTLCLDSTKIVQKPNIKHSIRFINHLCASVLLLFKQKCDKEDLYSLPRIERYALSP